MKKFMFSAVALVAFSFAGMANTGGEEKEFINIESTTNYYGPCEDYAAAVMALAAYFGYDEFDTHLIGQQANEDCLKKEKEKSNGL